MNNNIAEVINIAKTAKNNIDREDRLKKYFEALACEMVSKALEESDRELAAQYGKDGWQVERRDFRTLQTTYGTIIIKRRRMRKDGEAGIYPLDKELGIRRYHKDIAPALNTMLPRLPPRLYTEPLPWQSTH